MGLLSRLPADTHGLLEQLSNPSYFMGWASAALDAYRIADQGPKRSERPPARPAAQGLTGLHANIRYHAEQLWPVGGQPVPSNAERRNRAITDAFNTAGDGPPCISSIKYALQDTRFMKSRPHLRKS